MGGERLRLAILGAARNVPFSVVQPVRENADLRERLEVIGIASREAAEAEAHAKEWGIPKVYTDYEELLADPSVEAVYNVLPGPMRCQWTVRALLAGKHVLSETPLSSNAREALVMQRAAEDAGRVMLEGSHPTCHPVSKRVREMLVEGEIGKLERIDLDLPVGHSLQGKIVCAKTGALLGLGIHGLAIVRFLCGEEPSVVHASMQPSSQDPSVEVSMSCDLLLPCGAEARVACSVAEEGSKLPSTYTITGSNGVIQVKEWFAGGTGSHEISHELFDGCGTKSVEYVVNPQTRDTFYFQWMAFVDEVRQQEQKQAHNAGGMPWHYASSSGSPADAVRNMAVIDAIYRAAGVSPRQTEFHPPQPYDRIGMAKL